MRIKQEGTGSDSLDSASVWIAIGIGESDVKCVLWIISLLTLFERKFVPSLYTQEPKPQG